MSRPVTSFAAVVAVVAAGVAAGTLTRPDDQAPTSAERRVAVQRADAVCPLPTADDGRSLVSMATPPRPSESGAGEEVTGGAALSPLGEESEPAAELAERGAVTATEVDRSSAAPMVGRAESDLAPGFALDQTTLVEDGADRGLSGMACTPPATDFWFVGAGSGEGQRAQLFLTNSEKSPAQVDLEIYGPEGRVDSPLIHGIVVDAGQQQHYDLATLAPDTAPLTLHVVVRAGRLAAAVLSQETDGLDPLGVDWLPPAAAPAAEAVVPGLPAGAGRRSLVLAVPGDTHANVSVKVATGNGSFAPAGAAEVEVPPGTVQQIDLSESIQDQAATLMLSSDAPVVAGARVSLGDGDDARDSAFVAATPGLAEPAVVADNRTGEDMASALVLTALRGDMTVEVTTFGAGDPRAKTVEVPAGLTVAARLGPEPSDEIATYAVVVNPGRGSGAVFGSRVIQVGHSDGPMVTVQPLVEDRATVAVPEVESDLSVGIPAS